MASSYHQQQQLGQQIINNYHNTNHQQQSGPTARDPQSFPPLQQQQQQHQQQSFQQQQPPVGIHPQDIFPSNSMQIHSSNLNQNLNLASAHHHLHHLESARRSASSSSAEHGQFSMSNFTVAPSNHLLQASQKSALVKNSNTAGASNQESSHVYSAVYSGVSVFEMMCRNVAVMRRQKDSYLNATQVLKVANIEKGKRTKILEKEILNKEHEKVQGGYGKYQGTWIPFERGLELAKQYCVADLLKPLFEFDPDTALDQSHLAPPPSQPRAPSRRTSGPNSSAKNATALQQQQPQVVSVTVNKRIKMDSTHTYVESPEHQHRDLYLDDTVGFGGEQQQFFEFHEPKIYAPPHHPSNLHMHHYQAYYNVDPYGLHHQFNNHHMSASGNPHIAAAAENSAERHRASIMSLFLNQAGGTNGDHANEDLVLSPHTMMAPDFDINLILDDQGHTALHWASALANVKLIPSLLQKGARLDFLNYAGESALIRSVMVSHNYDSQSFLDLLSLLKDIICIPDKKNRTVLHHICLSASSKGRVNSCIYYMQCILEFYANSVHDEAVSSEMVHSDHQNSLSSRFRSILNIVDICGDTAVNIASRLGNRHLFDLLVEAGADVSIPNYATLKPSDYGFEALNHPSSQTTPVLATVLYPSIKTDQENVAGYSDQHLQQQHQNVPSEKSQSEVIAELQSQLSTLSREVSHYRKTIAPLEVENAEIPLLKYRIMSLESTIKEKANKRGDTSGEKSSADQTPTSSQGPEGDEAGAGGNDEILRLKESLVHQKAVEAHLCQEIKSLRATASQHESFCKRIISECCNVPLENVAEILEPLLDCVETSDSFSLDARLVSSFMDEMRASPTSSSKPTSKGSKREQIKEQQRVWISGMQEEKRQTPLSSSPPTSSLSHQLQHAETAINSKTDVVFDNWNQIASSKSIGGARISSRMEGDNGTASTCRICFDEMQLPMLIVPCGHSFCQKCIDGLGIGLQCPACLAGIQHIVPNIALKDLLDRKRFESFPAATAQSQSSAALQSIGYGMVANPIDFDEDPENVIRKYKDQLNRLNDRIELLESERDNVDKEIYSKTTRLETMTKTVEESRTEMKNLAAKIEAIRARMVELNDIGKQTQPLIPRMETEITDLQSKKETIKDTLESLFAKTEMLSNGTLDSSGDNNYVHSLPPFANEANKALSRKIKALEAKENSFAATIDDSALRADAILSHMKNVQSETNHTQALYDAKNRQIETEEHFKQLAERENGRISSEMNRIGSELGRISDYLTFLQTSIYRGNEKIEAVRAEFKLETDELNEWLRVQQEKEEDNLALIKYTKEDDSKEKELSLAIEKLVTQVNKSKANLTAEVTETQVAQIELENTTEAFKQLHQERQDLIHQWEEAVTTMAKRDEDIDGCQNNYRAQKIEIRKMQEKIKEKEEVFDVQLNLNNETEKNIVMAERRVAKLREEESGAIRRLQQYKDEVEVLKNTLSKSSSDLVNKRSELSNLKGNLRDKQEKLEASKNHHMDLKKKMASLDDESVTLEARAEQLQELLDKEIQRDHELDKTIKTLREAQFKQSQTLFKLRQEEKNLAAEIVGGEAACRNLKSKIHKIDQEALKQRAMLYSMEFGVQQLERKIRRLEGDRTDEEKNELLAKIEVLNAKYEQQLQKWNTLNSQLKRSQEDLRESKRQLNTLTKQKAELNTSIGELNLYNESAAHQLLSKVKEKENLMVEENILRLELRRLRSFVHARSDEVLTLETRKLQLNLALEERTKEIEIHKDMLRVQLKNAEEERHSANIELRDRVGKVEKLKRRYEILMTQFAPEDGEEDHSQAFYVIKAAQKREELQREGDELDANIRKAEKEIKALENTLRLMNDRNEQYRSNLYRAEVDGNDLQHKEMLDTEYQQVIDSFKRKRTVIQDLQLQLQESEKSFGTISAKEAEKLQQVHVLEAKCDAAGRDIEEQAVKRSRALQFVHKTAKLLRKKEGTNSITAIEQDFMIRAVREMGTLALQDLEKLMQSYPDVEGRIRGLMELHGLKAPSRSVSRVSSRASSVADMYSPSGSGRSSAVERKPAYPGLLPETEDSKPSSEFVPTLRQKVIDQLEQSSGVSASKPQTPSPRTAPSESNHADEGTGSESPIIIGDEARLKLMSTTDLNASLNLPKPDSAPLSRSNSGSSIKKGASSLVESKSKLATSTKSSPAGSRSSSRAPSRASVASEKSVGKATTEGLSLQGTSATKSQALPLQKRGSITGSDRIKDTGRSSSAQSNQ